MAWSSKSLYKSLGEILKYPDDSDIGLFIEVDLKFLDYMKKKTKSFPFCPEKKKNNTDKNNDYMNKIKHENSTKANKTNM